MHSRGALQNPISSRRLFVVVIIDLLNAEWDLYQDGQQVKLFCYTTDPQTNDRGNITRRYHTNECMNAWKLKF